MCVCVCVCVRVCVRVCLNTSKTKYVINILVKAFVKVDHIYISSYTFL